MLPMIQQVSPLAGFAIIALFVFLAIGGMLAYAVHVGSSSSNEQQQQQPNPSGIVLSAKKAQQAKEEKEFFEKNSQFFR